MNRTEMNWLEDHDACQPAMEWLKKGRFASLSEAWPKCTRADWMMWLLWKTGSDPKKMRLAALDIAETVLPIWEAWSQTREPHEVIEAARRYLAEPTEKNRSALQTAQAAAWAAWAASDAASRAAEAACADAAARAASDAAARAEAEAAWAAAEAARAARAARAAADAAWAAAKAAKDHPDILRAQADIVRKYFPAAPEVTP